KESCERQVWLGTQPQRNGVGEHCGRDSRRRRFTTCHLKSDKRFVGTREPMKIRGCDRSDETRKVSVLSARRRLKRGAEPRVELDQLTVGPCRPRRRAMSQARAIAERGTMRQPIVAIARPIIRFGISYLFADKLCHRRRGIARNGTAGSELVIYAR